MVLGETEDSTPTTEVVGGQPTRPPPQTPPPTLQHQPLGEQESLRAPNTQQHKKDHAISIINLAWKLGHVQIVITVPCGILKVQDQDITETFPSKNEKLTNLKIQCTIHFIMTEKYKADSIPRTKVKYQLRLSSGVRLAAFNIKKPWQRLRVYKS